MHFSMIEHGAYRQLLDWIYLDEKPIPKETEVVFRRLSARTEEEQKAIQNVLKEMFDLTDDGYVQRRCMGEIMVYQRQVARAQINGKLGGRPRKTEVVISGFSEKTQTKANQEPITNNHKPITNNQEPKNKTMSSELDSRVNEIFEYWKIELEHPNSRIDKKRSNAILERLKEGYTVERIKEAIRGIKLCPHNMGQNERGQVYDDIELICRSGANVDRFADAEFKRPMDKLTKRMADCLLPITDGSDKL